MQISAIATAFSAAAGALAGIIAFVPLAVVIGRVRRGSVDAAIGKGFLVVGVSFIILIAAVLIARLVCAAGLIAFVSGETTGFIVCWVIEAARGIARSDG